jgi:hypothetical protein
VGRFLESEFDFPARYEVEQLRQLDRSTARAVYGFPDAYAVDPQQQQKADRPIILVRPTEKEPWIGVFYGGGYNYPAGARDRLIGWPDEVSFCVVYAGGATVVRTDAPKEAFEIETFPITGVLVAPAHGLVVFSDFTSFTAYNRTGLRWQAEVASDEATLSHVEGEALVGTGFVAGSTHPLQVDLATGRLLD